MEIWVVGPEPSGSLAGSSLQRVLQEDNGGMPTPADPELAKQVIDQAIELAHIAPVLHDISDGGLAVAVAEIAIGSGVGVDVEDDHLFCEDPHRFVLAAHPGSVDFPTDLARHVGLMGGDVINLNGSSISLAKARDLYENALPRRMA